MIDMSPYLCAGEAWESLCQQYGVNWSILLLRTSPGPLSSCIGSGKPFNYLDIRFSQYSKKFVIHFSRQSLYSALSSTLRLELDYTLQTALDHSTIKGAST